MSLRVIGGELRGRTLVVPPGRSLRPTSNRVREALFSSVGERLPGARVLDLYAGSGALGIEALSRGAATAVFVERAAVAVRVLQRNLDALGLSERGVVMRCDALVALRRLPSSPEARFDLVFADPPYGAEDLSETLASLVERGLLAPAGAVVIETSRRHPVRAVRGLECERERTYGDTVLSRWRAPQVPDPREPTADAASG